MVIVQEIPYAVIGRCETESPDRFQIDLWSKNQVVIHLIEKIWLYQVPANQSNAVCRWTVCLSVFKTAGSTIRIRCAAPDLVENQYDGKAYWVKSALFSTAARISD